MPAISVGAIYSGVQLDGHWMGTPILIVQLMTHPDTAPPPPGSLDGSYPLAEWDYDPAAEVSLQKLLERRPGSSPHFASVGAATLQAMVTSFRERHILIIGRDPGLYDLAPLVNPLIAGGRTVQIETTVMRTSLAISKAWLTLLSLPTRVGDESVSNTDWMNPRPDEVLACIRHRCDLDRSELTFGSRKIQVWLRPSPFADPGIYRQCVTVATRHPGWRVSPAAK